MSNSAAGQAPAAPTPPGDLARDRYGRRPQWSHPRRVAVFSVLLCLAVAWTGWVALRVGVPAVTWQEIGFRVISDSNAELTFEVTVTERPDGDRLLCSVQAQNAVHSDVGLRDVDLGPAQRGTISRTMQVPTAEPAATVRVKDCVLR